MDVICQFLPEQMAGVVEYLLGYEIALLCRLEYVFGGNKVDVSHISQQGRLRIRYSLNNNCRPVRRNRFQLYFQ